MFFLNELKMIFNNGIIFILIIIAYFLIFKVSERLKQHGYKRDFYIVKTTGVLYGVLSIAALIFITIY